MRLIREVTDEEMVDAFVEADLGSTRHGALWADFVLGDLSLYDGSCRHARALRRIALSYIRGYGRNVALFRAFPPDASWRLVAVAVRELENWLYLPVDGWLALSDNSRLLRDGVANVGKLPSQDETSDCILAVEGDVRNGKTYPPIIAAALNESSPHIVVEGHTRATAYVRALAPDDEVQAIVGYSAALASWAFF